MLLCRKDTFFFLIYKIGDWSLNRKQRFKVKICPNNIALVLENMSDGHISILGKRKKKYVKSIILQIFLEILSHLKEKSSLSPYKHGIEWLKYECLSDIINFRCLLLKADYGIFYFELETLLNKLVKPCSYFFQKYDFERKCRPN